MKLLVQTEGERRTIAASAITLRESGAYLEFDDDLASVIDYADLEGITIEAAGGRFLHVTIDGRPW